MAAASLFMLSAVQAQTVTLPAGPSVVRGQATVSSTGTAMTVTNTNNTILNWRSFSIGARGTVEFVQPNAQSQVLNRVTGNDPSQIFGNLQSNGRVWLLNPNGVLFGKGARIDVAGLVASTLNVNDAEWQAGNYRLSNSLACCGRAAVVNEGDLRTPLGGRIALIGGSGGVINRGSIDAPGGQLLLAAGNSVDLIDTGAPNITLRVPAPLGTVENSGYMVARGGRIDAQAAIVNQQGYMSADALATGNGGEIVLRASQRVTLGVESVTRADGSWYSDDEGGGNRTGNGGRIVVHGDQAAQVRGRLAARSGDLAGNGGSIETSGALLDVRAAIDAGADNGRAGTWLAQGANVAIANVGAPLVAIGAAPSAAPVLAASSIGAALASGTNVAVVARSISATAGETTGNIVMAGVPLSAASRRDVSLTFDAQNNLGFTGSSIDAQGSSTAIGLSAENVALANTTVRSNGRISVAADRLGLLRIATVGGAGATLASGAVGDAIVVHGRSGDGLAVVANNAGSAALNTPNGRWLVYARSPVADELADLRGLPYAFTQHGASFEAGGDIVTPHPGNGLLYSATAGQVQLAGAPVKTYDGNTAGALLPSAISVSGGLLAGERAVFAPAVRGTYDDRNAGDRGFTLAPDAVRFVDARGRPVFGYENNLADLRGRIARAPLTVLGATAADRVYNGTTDAQITSVAFTGLVGAEQIGATAAAAFVDANAGTGKLVNGNVTGMSDGANGGLASNYVLPDNTFMTRATISLATLTYVADAAAWTLPASTPPLSGTVTGFVSGETQASATSGSLQFTAPADASVAPGIYGVVGSGLTARSYNFVQASGNATALTVTPPPVTPPPVTPPPVTPPPVTPPPVTPPPVTPPPVTPPPVVAPPPPAVTPPPPAPPPVVLPEVDVRPPAPDTIIAAYGGPALFPQPPTQPTSTTGRALDVSQWLQVNTAAGTSTFAAVPVADLSQDSLSSLLSARDRYKARVFAEALEQLEREPMLADAPDCKTPQQIETGTCLITETLKREMAARSGVTQAEAAPTPTPTPTLAPAAQEAARVAAAPIAEPLPSFAAKRRVKAATLPQIERKVAVLIGIDDYTDARIPKLANAAGDARAVGALLESLLGYETVVLANAGKAQIIRTLNTLAATLGAKDSIVVYYAGHGQLVSGTGLGYWQVGDADASDAKSWLSNADIGKLISRLGASQVALVSDSCFSGSLVSDERIRPLASSADAGTLLSRRAAVVMSSGGNEPVFDAGKNGHSPFAFSLMQALQGVPTWQAGGNVFERVRFAVARELPQRPRYGAAVAGGHEAGSDYLFERRELE